MASVYKKSLIIFGYSETVSLGLLDNSKLVKVKEFNISEDNNEDEFFGKISKFISNKDRFNNVFYSCGPGGFTIIRRIMSYIKALKFKHYSNTNFIGLNNLLIIANYLNQEYKIKGQGYILAILNHSKDNFVQVYKKKNNSYFSLESLSDIQNLDLDAIETHLDAINLSIQNVNSVYLGSNPNDVLFLNNVKLADRFNIFEIIAKISDLIDNDKISKTSHKHFFEEKSKPLYGKLPSTN
mgnify:CR=1 FL=1|tara:strand:+ start:347 stop:1063 length:717 start_codon:yes stop_codon:yes gene_type:complete